MQQQALVSVLFNWNKSFVYVTTAAYFATRIEGAPPYDAGEPDPALSLEAAKALQEKLAAMGVQDVVILGMKAHQIAPVVPDLMTLIGPHTLVVTAQNGIPWWYFHKHGGPYEGRRIEAVDPGGVISASLPVERALGCIVYPAAELDAPLIGSTIDAKPRPMALLIASPASSAR